MNATLSTLNEWELSDLLYADNPSPKTRDTVIREILRRRLAGIGADNRCTCSCANICPLERVGSMERCRKEELEAFGREEINHA
jgi:hypothetical protein